MTILKFVAQKGILTTEKENNVHMLKVKAFCLLKFIVKKIVQEVAQFDTVLVIFYSSSFFIYSKIYFY